MFNHHLIWAYGTDKNAQSVKPHLEGAYEFKVKLLESKTDHYHLYMLDREADYRELGNISSACRCLIVYAKIGVFDNLGYQYIAFCGNLIYECPLTNVSVAQCKEKYNLDASVFSRL